MNAQTASSEPSGVLDGYASGCCDNGCEFDPPKGMGTNGGCRCLKDVRPPSLRREILYKVRELKKQVRELDGLQELRDAVVSGERPGDTLIRLAGLIRSTQIDSDQLTVSDWTDWLRDFGQRLNDA